MRFFAALPLAAVLASSVCAEDAPKSATTAVVLKPQTECPIMAGSAINKNLFADVEGKRIYVCCKGCIAPIKADPKKIIADMTAKGIALEDAPVAPVSATAATK
jgi:hypothetical protein